MEKARTYTPVLILLGIGVAGATGYYFYDRSQKLGNNFTREDLIRSNTADILNIKEQKRPPKSVVRTARKFVKTSLQPMRNEHGHPIFINSWWRHEKTNKEVGGVWNSGHLDGDTVDMRTVIGGVFRNDLLAKSVLTSGVPFAKMILEYGTKTRPLLIHFRAPAGDNRQIILRKDDAGTYTPVSRGEILAWS